MEHERVDGRIKGRIGWRLICFERERESGISARGEKEAVSFFALSLY